MSLGDPRILFGVHSISPYSRTDGMPYGILKVLAGGTLSLQAPIEQLYGGSNKFSWAAESKTIASDMSVKVKAYPGFLFQIFLGASVTDNSAETGGSVTTLTNFKGTTAKSATIGIASIAVKSGSETDVKFGRFVVKVVSATTVDVYLLSDVDIDRGTDGTYQSDLLKITATPLTIVTATAVTIPNFGLELTGGSGTIGMTVGDTASFQSRPINTGSSDIVVGANPTTLPAFSAVMLAQRRADGSMFEITAYNMIGSGLPIAMDEFAFSQTEIKMTLLYDSSKNKVFDIRSIVPSTVN